MAGRSWRDIWRMESARAFAPLREGGAARREMAYGLRVRSGGKGRRGEYCGLPSKQAFAWSIRRGIDSFVAGGKSWLPRRPTAVLPPSRPLPLVFCHASSFHSWPRHPPLGGGRGLSPFLLLAFVEFHGWFQQIPRSTKVVVHRKVHSFACFGGRAASPFAAVRLPSAWKALHLPSCRDRFARRAGDCPPYPQPVKYECLDFMLY